MSTAAQSLMLDAALPLKAFVAGYPDLKAEPDVILLLHTVPLLTPLTRGATAAEI